MKRKKPMALAEIGILLVFIGMILIIVGSLTQASKSETKVAFGGFIGPIPFGFGNDKQLVTIVIIVAAVIFIFWTLINYIKW